jgi:hypothetical protein
MTLNSLPYSFIWFYKSYDIVVINECNIDLVLDNNNNELFSLFVYALNNIYYTSSYYFVYKSNIINIEYSYF